MQFKQVIFLLIGVFLAAGSLLTTPRIDTIYLSNPSDYPLYYAMNLPFLYYVSIIYLSVLAIFSKNRTIKLISVVLVALIVEFTTSLMLANPWVPDQYPYLSEVTLLAKNGHITQWHWLDQTPGLALMFSQVMLVAGLGPLELSMLYPLLFVFVVPLAFSTGEKICGDGAIPLLLFMGFSVHQPNVFHRNTIFLIVFIVFLYFFVRKINQSSFAYPVIYTLITFALTMYYPGTIVPLLALVVVSFLFMILYQKRSKIVTLNTSLLLFSIYVAWYAFVADWQFNWMSGQVIGGLQDFIYPDTERFLSITAYGQTNMTFLFDLLMNLRYVVLGLLIVLLLPAIGYVLLKRKNFDSNAIFISSFSLVIIGIFFILAGFIYTGVGFIFKFHTFFVFICVISICLLLKIPPTRYRKKIKTILGVIAIILLLIIPLLSYATLPFLHTTTPELKAKTFTETYYKGTVGIRATELNMAYHLFGVLNNRSVVEPNPILSPEEPIYDDVNYLTVQRFLVRDGFLIYDTSYKEYLDNATYHLSLSHNLVYSNGNYSKFFILK